MAIDPVFFEQILANLPEGITITDRSFQILYQNASARRAFGDCVGKLCYQAYEGKKHICADCRLVDVFAHGKSQIEQRTAVSDDGTATCWEVRYFPLFDQNGEIVAGVKLGQDVTQRQLGMENERNLRFFRSLDRINRVIQQSSNNEQVLRDVLDTVLDIFSCDRAFLLFPCDPAASTWHVPMERTRDRFPGLFAAGGTASMDQEVADTMQLLLAADGPLCFGPGMAHALPSDLAKEFSIQSFMAMSLHPKIGEPWQFGIHQCNRPRFWTADDVRLMQEIGCRLADSLTASLSHEKQLANQRFLDSVIESIPSMLFVKDAQTLRVVRTNKAGERFFGYSKEEVLDKQAAEIFPKQLADTMEYYDRQVAEQKQAVDIPLQKIVLADDIERVLHFRKVPLLSKKGIPEYLLCIGEDLTTQKKAEESLDILFQAVAQVPVSIIILDTSGIIEFANANFSTTTGYSSSEVLGRTLRILNSDKIPKETQEQLWEVIRSGEIWHGILQNRRKTGALFWEQVTIAPIRDVEQRITHYVAISADITERQSLEDQLRQAQKMEAIGRLAGGVAHDFNNMLGVIIGHTEMLLQDIDAKNPIFSPLRDILKVAEKSSNLTRQLLAFARKQNISPQLADLNVIVGGMIKILHKIAGEDIHLSWSPGQNLWPVRIDPGQIDQILANLTVNARDAINGVGKVAIETKNVHLDEEYCAVHPGFLPGEYVSLAVTDSGCGIPPEICHKIFEPFFTTKEVGKGTGLGLATVYGIAKQNKGFVEVRSELGCGSTFTLYFPRQACAVAFQQQNSPTAELVQPGSETILLVEDDLEILKVSTRMLERAGYTVLPCSMPLQAIQLLETHADAIDLLITDVIMPKMSGRDLASAMQSRKPGLKILFMSGYTSNEIADHGVLVSGIHFLTKPFSRQELLSKVRTALSH